MNESLSIISRDMIVAVFFLTYFNQMLECGFHLPISLGVINYHSCLGIHVYPFLGIPSLIPGLEYPVLVICSYPVVHLKDEHFPLIPCCLMHY